MSLLCFSELFPGASARVCHVDGVPYVSVRDLIMLVCQKDVNQANEVWRRLDDNIKDGLFDELTSFKFPNERETRVITIKGGTELAMLLPGNMARAIRQKVVGVFIRYTAGDVSLIEDIQANAASAAPINLLARESLVAPKGQSAIIVQNRPVVKRPRVLALVDSALLKPRLPLTKDEREELWGKYYPEGSVVANCLLCETRPVFLLACGFEAAHARARAMGGVDELWNLLPVCSGCNNAMGTDHALKWVASAGHHWIASVSGNKQGNHARIHGPNGLIDRIISIMFSSYQRDCDEDDAVFMRFKVLAHIPKSAIASLCVGLEYTSTFGFLSARQIDDLRISN